MIHHLSNHLKSASYRTAPSSSFEFQGHDFAISGCIRIPITKKLKKLSIQFFFLVKVDILIFILRYFVFI